MKTSTMAKMTKVKMTPKEMEETLNSTMEKKGSNMDVTNRRRDNDLDKNHDQKPKIDKEINKNEAEAKATSKSIMVENTPTMS